MIWNTERETLSRSELEALQSELLRRQVAAVYEKVPFYRQAFRDRGLRPDDIRSVNDLTRLPFTRKADFRDNYPFGLLAVPRRELSRIHASSGTTGKPTVVAYTRNDLANWREVCARNLARRRRDARRHGANRHGLRPVHRRPGAGTMAANIWAPRWCPCPPATPNDRSC